MQTTAGGACVCSARQQPIRYHCKRCRDIEYCFDVEHMIEFLTRRLRWEILVVVAVAISCYPYDLEGRCT